MKLNKWIIHPNFCNRDLDCSKYKKSIHQQGKEKVLAEMSNVEINQSVQIPLYTT